MVVTLLLFACQECPSLDEIVVGGDAATADGEAWVRAGIEEVRAWVGPDATCVGAVYIQDEGVTEGAGGTYHAASRDIYLRPDASLLGATRHELCHALDHQAGWVSLDHSDIFPATWVAESERYPTEEERILEAFAISCAEGPRSTVFAEALAQRCGGNEWLDAMRYHGDHTFLAWEDLGTEPAGETSISLRRVALPPLKVRSGPVVGGGAVFVLTERLVRIDPDTGEIVAEVPVPMEWGTLIGGDEGPVLDVDGQAWLWRAGAWDPLGDVTGTPSPGFLHDGDVWAAQTEDAFRIRPGVGVVDVVEAEDLGVAWSGFSVGSAGYTLVADGWIRTFDADERSFTTVVGAVGFDPHRATQLPGGLVAVTWSDRYSSELGFQRAGVAIGNPADGRWWLADEPCWADAISPDHELLLVEGALYVWERLSDGTSAITRVTWG